MDSHTADLERKYGFGTVRLSILLLILASLDDNPSIPWLSIWITYGIFGVGGALLNLHKLSLKFQLVILSILIANFIHASVSPRGPSGREVLFMYFFKTLLGDVFSGKIDHSVWFKSIGVALILWTLLSSRLVSLLPNFWQVSVILQGNWPLFGPQLACHWLCEMGDNYGEKYAFFRHRISYEISCIVIYYLLLSYGNGGVGTALLFSDMIASLLYRVTNYVWVKIFK